MKTIPTYQWTPAENNDTVFDDKKLSLEEESPIGVTIEKIQQLSALLAGYVIDNENKTKWTNERSILENKLHSMVSNATKNTSIASENIPTILESTRLEVIKMLTEYGCTVTQGEHEGDIHYYKANPASPTTTEKPVEPTEF